MSRIPQSAWIKYISNIRRLGEKAESEMKAFYKSEMADFTAGKYTRTEHFDRIAQYAKAIVDKYGEGSSELACEMYEWIAEFEKENIANAIPAATASYEDVRKATYATADQVEPMTGIVKRMVKQASADTMLQNAKRDGAYFAWIPSGDTCAFCIALASRGWQRASKKTIKGDHADHIHNNCDCNFCIRFHGDTDVQGYDPQKYEDMYYGADGMSANERIRNLRSSIDAERRDEINSQKRAAYAKRIEFNKRIDKAPK